MKVLLVDDHPLILSALQAMIQELDPDVRSRPSAAPRRRVRRWRPTPSSTWCCWTCKLGDASGFDVLVEMRKAHPALPVVVISASDRASDVIQAIDLGAMGFVPKRASNDTLVDALRLVMAGGIYVPAMHLGGQAGRPAARRRRRSRWPRRPPTRSRPRSRIWASRRARPTCSRNCCKGKPNKEIARRLGLSVETVKDHVQAVLRALGVSSRTQAVLAVSQMSIQGMKSWRNSQR
jgi:DNA-binding NarL/FixJ family response regulator